MTRVSVSVLFLACMSYTSSYSEQSNAKKEKSAGKVEKKRARQEVKEVRREEHHLTLEERARLLQSWKIKKRERRAQDQYDGKYADLYSVPVWPVYALFTERHTTLAVLSYEYEGAENAFLDHGGKHNLSKLVFGESDFLLKDILLESKLLDQGSVASSAQQDDQFLLYLADTHCDMRASAQEHRVSFDLMRFFIKRSLSFGFHVPFVISKHHNTIRHRLPDGVLDAMTKTVDQGPDVPAGTLFRRLYGGRFKRFFRDLLARKDLKYQKNDTTLGIGDIAFYTTLRVRSRKYEHGKLGLRLTFPTGKEAVDTKLWGPELGHGHFKADVFFALFISLDYWINPTFFSQVTFFGSSTHEMRVPQKRTFLGTTQDNEEVSFETPDGQTVDDYFLFGPERLVAFKNSSSFSQFDTTLREFSDSSVPVRMREGFELFIRIGNIFEKFWMRRGSLDIYYDITMKARNSVLGRVPCDVFDRELIETHTTQIGHAVGIAYTYQFDKATRCSLGFDYRFFGRNMTERFHVEALVSASF